jgi:SNF2 family DNA or RNA helicase
MKEKFGETFKVIDRAVMEASWGRNVWLEENQAITSMDFAKQEDVMLSLAEATWDLVIVDEAHKLAAYEYGSGKITKTQRYKLGELLSKNSNYLLFLTATPHRGDPSNFRLFLELLEPGFFAINEILMESIRNRENPLFLRRLKEDLKTFDGTPIFPPRKVKTVKYRLSDYEKRLYNAFQISCKVTYPSFSNIPMWDSNLPPRLQDSPPIKSSNVVLSRASLIYSSFPYRNP